MSFLFPAVQSLPWLKTAVQSKAGAAGLIGQIIVKGRGASIPQKLIEKAPLPIKKKVKNGDSVVQWMGNQGPVYVISMEIVENQNHYGLFSPAPYAMTRDLVGTCFRQLLNEDLKEVRIEYIGDSEEELVGALVGVELAQYRFQNHFPKAQKNSIPLKIKSKFKNQKKLVEQAALLGESVNLSRLLVDLPPNALQPKNYADLLKKMFTTQKKTKVNVWGMARLEKEKMGLHLAVGQGAEQEPHLVHIEYRGASSKEKPFAFVGKGITFDSGGLDIKPGSGMRLMKKDMGGSASVAGLAWWVIQSGLSLNCDFYFAIAENAVSEKSFRPGDILQSRSGLTVEIDNTDAEGRLVLADALSVATEKKPQLVIDLATLTGAIKYGLGSNVPGLFSNRDNLAEALMKSGQARGDLFWRMPLIPEEKGRLKSEVADVVNSTNGFGGAITAALFLEMFVAGVPWAHFDIYAWMDRAKGPFAAAGGSGQIVQALSHFLTQQQ